MPKFPKYKAPDGITVKQDFTVNDHYGTKTYLWVLFGEQHAIAFYDRGKDDPHLLMDVLTEDDENWFRSSDCSLGSTFWLNDMHKIVVEADIFCKCMFYPDMHNGSRIDRRPGEVVMETICPSCLTALVGTDAGCACGAYPASAKKGE